MVITDESLTITNFVNSQVIQIHSKIIGKIGLHVLQIPISFQKKRTYSSTDIMLL